MSPVPALAGARSISAYSEFCGIMPQAVRCMGWRSPNARPPRNQEPPRDRAPSEPIYQLSVGNHVCFIALRVGKCWGWNANGELGIGVASGNKLVSRPTPVFGDRQLQEIQSGVGATCATDIVYSLFCWGNLSGGIDEPDRCSHSREFGSTNDCALRPTPLLLDVKVRRIAMGYLHYCVLTTKQMARCWGLGAKGELGHGTTDNILMPPRVDGAGSAHRRSALLRALPLVLLGGLGILLLGADIRKRA